MKYLIGLLLVLTGCAEDSYKKCNVYWINGFGAAELFDVRSCGEVKGNIGKCGYFKRVQANVEMYCVSPIIIEEVLNDAK